MSASDDEERREPVLLTGHKPPANRRVPTIMNQQDKKVSLFSSRREGPEYVLDSENACGKPPKKHSKAWLVILLVILAVAVLAASAFMTFNFFGARDWAFSLLEAGHSEPSEASSPSKDETEAVVSEESSIPEIEESPAESSTEPSQAEEQTHGWVINQMGYTYLYEGCGIEQFNFTESTLGKFSEQMNVLGSKITTSSHIFCLPIPTRISYYQNEIPVQVRREDNFFNSSQRDFLDALSQALPSKMKLIDLYEVFDYAYQQGNDPYFKTDKNWTSDAAYLAYTRYCEMRKLTPVQLSDYTKIEKEGFLGSFYYATINDPKNDLMEPEKFAYYQNKATTDSVNTVYQNGLTFKNYCLADNLVSDVSDSYFVYLGTSKAHFKITTKAGTGNRMLIIGDQSAAAMIPFLANHFNEIDYYDISQSTESITDILSQHRYNDILVCAYMTNMVKGEFPGYLSNLLGMTEQTQQESSAE